MEAIKAAEHQKPLTVEEKISSNYLVMDKIIEYLNVAGLKVFRLVCSDWYKNSIVAWNKKAIVHIEPPVGLPNTDGFVRGKGPENLVKFLKETCDKDFRNILGEHPFRSFSLSTGKLEEGDESKEARTAMENLWQECGQFASHIQLNLHNLHSKHSLESIVRELGPNVTTLEVNDDSGYRNISSVFLEGPVHKQVKSLKISYQHDVFRYCSLIKFPNLDELKVLSPSNMQGCSLNSLLFSNLRTFRFSKKKRNILNLRHLDLITSRSQDLNSFVEANLPLTYLSLNIGGGTSSSTFQQCMEHYAKSLKTLKLRESAHQRFSMPPGFADKMDFRNLQVLELWGNLIDNINFLQNAPQLRKLRLDLLCNLVTGERGKRRNRNMEQLSLVDGTRNIVENSKVIKGPNTVQWLELQELNLDFQLSEDSWIILKRYMPNLWSLGAPLDNTSFRLVCALWPKLRKLGLRVGSDIDDGGIVGEYGSKEKDVSRQPTILDIKYLESFELEKCGQGKLTNRSAEIAFLKMDWLRSLKIFVSPHLFSEEVEMQLKAQIGRVEIIRNGQNENWNQ